MNSQEKPFCLEDCVEPMDIGIGKCYPEEDVKKAVKLILNELYVMPDYDENLQKQDEHIDRIFLKIFGQKLVSDGE